METIITGTGVRYLDNAGAAWEYLRNDGTNNYPHELARIRDGRTEFFSSDGECGTWELSEPRIRILSRIESDETWKAGDECYVYGDPTVPRIIVHVDGNEAWLRSGDQGGLVVRIEKLRRPVKRRVFEATVIMPPDATNPTIAVYLHGASTATEITEAEMKAARLKILAALNASEVTP